VVRWL
jgi:hypothetical protein